MTDRFDPLARQIEGEVLTDPFDRGRYATDASIYQIVPEAVVVPRRFEDVEAALAFAREQGLPLTARGGGTSQAGQTINRGIVVDFSRHLNRVLAHDAEAGTVTVEPGLVLDELNRSLKPHGQWLPVDVSTASRATIGGMTANNSCGSRSIRYGMMRDHVAAIEGLMADGTRRRFEPVDAATNDPLARDLLALGTREAEEVEARFPKTARRVGGYNLDALVANGHAPSLATLLVGSEGTLALSERIELRLSPVLGRKALGVCHFPTFRASMEAAQHIAPLGPVAIELVDETMIGLGRDIPAFRPVVERFVEGEPAALLLVEFAERDHAESLHRLDALEGVMADLRAGPVVKVADPAFQSRIWEVRTQGLNIMMSMRSEGKPISFVEDCAVALPDLADFTERLTKVFRDHGTEGTWYAHASVGLLHVRPVINLKEAAGAKQMRAIAEAAFDLVAEYKGSHSGEHGDGIVRSEFHERMFGSRLVRAFEDVKDRFDPEGTLNPHRIVRPPRMDDRSLFRTPPGYRRETPPTRLDWSGWADGIAGAAEMCNNNGACRKLKGGVMCPSYRVTMRERDATRGRANTLRLALTGQLGPDALASDAMAETLKLCVSCKACQRECPMSVDMAAMKAEVLAKRAERHGVPLRERLVAALPRYAPAASRLRWLANARDRVPGLASLTERVAGLSAKRPLPAFRRPFAEDGQDASASVLLFADTFNRHFEPAVLDAARRVLRAGGETVRVAEGHGRPLCCGRTYLAAGLMDDARIELLRSLAVLGPHLEAGGKVVGLEPSCVLTFRDEAPRLIDGWDVAMGRRVMTFGEWVAEADLPLGEVAGEALLHGHCHQKAHAVLAPVQEALARVPGLTVETVESSCCGMAGSFGYQAETQAESRAMAELSLAPAIRGAPKGTIVIADGTSCRHQIRDVTGRGAVHSAQVLARAVGSRGGAG